MLCTIFKVYKIQPLFEIKSQPYFMRFQNGGKKAILAIIAHACPMHGDDTNFPTETRLFSNSKNLSCVIHISK